MKKETMVIIADYSEESLITVDELCETYHISTDFLADLLEYEIVERKAPIEDGYFTLNELQKIKTALRLTHDLEINLPGVAVVLDLLDELKELREKNELLVKHLLK